MPTSSLTPQQLQKISHAIEQTMAQLQRMETGTDLKTMQSSARLCLKQLYEARELLQAYLPSNSNDGIYAGGFKT